MTKVITETIGLDLGDRNSTFCVLDERSGTVREEGRVETAPTSLGQFLRRWPSARVVMEVGNHSPWVSRLAAGACLQVLVANPRKTRFIFENDRKSDRVDARALARVGRMDPALLHPVQHRGEQAQVDQATIRMRRGLVDARTGLVNMLRGTVKSVGVRLKKRDAKSWGVEDLPQVPEVLRHAAKPLLAAIEDISRRIRALDRQVERMAKKKYPESATLQQVDGVGALTALTYQLVLEDPARLRRSRDAGPYFGLTPRRDQSGDMDKQLGISKGGDRLVRTLLVQCAHRMLGPFGKDSALRRHGLELAKRGGAAAKKRAVIAVARKLAVLLHRLWVTGEVYEPLRGARAG